MARGGARSRSGPTPDPNALNRERDRREWTRLPRSGCTLEPPTWPLEFMAPTRDELSMWDRLWRTPQAIVWHNDGVADTVALYVRQSIRAAGDEAPSSILTAVRQLSEHLLLSIPALRAARYYIEGSPDDVALNTDLTPVDSDAPRATGTDGAHVVHGRFTVVRPKDDDDDDSDPRATDE